MRKIRVLVNGAAGRMGREVVRAVEGADDLRLVGATDLGDDLPRALRRSRAEVAVDFTHPDCAVANVRSILEAGVRPVVGTTGFRKKDVAELRRLAERKKLGGLIAPNFSVGILLLNRFAQEAVRHFPNVEIVELHHKQKADAPSGTAAQTAALLGKAARDQLNRPDVREIESVPGARGAKVGGIPVHSVRLPGLLAHQEILFGGIGQVLTLRHDTMSREAFMPGVLLAIRRVRSLETLVYGLEDLLFSRRDLKSVPLA